MGFRKNRGMKGHSRHNSSLIGRKNQAKFENDCVLRNGHRIKITQPNSMIFYLTLLARRVLKIRRSAFFWDTRYSPLTMHAVLQHR